MISLRAYEDPFVSLETIRVRSYASKGYAEVCRLQS
jgi:hypothetical protein